ncbi:hypothetical protein NE237_010296 [Protea cynaroides]|uniref:DUF4220 domain-containing protein n=1 Tax=Protea cynaroides TaxID=273540 RepID=A0A9Q0KZZ5_9MAGN|nr:hypothetical protein NE237_010296 [Protea cynaroides]
MKLKYTLGEQISTEETGGILSTLGLGFVSDFLPSSLISSKFSDLGNQKVQQREKQDMEIIPAKIRRLWSEWELKYLVLISLCIQTLLILTASIRKHTAARKISFLVWTCYLIADWVATLALGVLAESVINNSGGDVHDESGNKKADLKSLWAPFLLLHLGGPDNITAFSLEDNELWLRHLLGLLFQVGTALYIFILSLPEQRLWLITVLMFMGGIIKYAERTLALMNASRSNFRKSMVTDPDPGPNYAKFMEEYSGKRDAGLDVKIDWKREPELQLPSSQDIEEGNGSDSKNMSEIELISKAHHFFQIFQRLIVDLILTFHDRNESRSFFTKASCNDAYKVIEIELGFLYEVLYTKAAVVHTLKGWFLRFISVSSIALASIIFFGVIEKQRYHSIDVTITYVLLGGAIALESWQLTRLLFTDWTVVWMKKKNLNRLTRFVFKVLSCKRPPNRPRWSNSMAQYNLITFCLKDQPFFWGKIMELFHVKDFFDNQWHRTYTKISEELKKFIFKDLKRKLQKARDSASYQHFRTCRGQLALQKINDEELDKSDLGILVLRPRSFSTEKRKKLMRNKPAKDCIR